MFDRVKNNLHINSLARRLRVAFTSIILLLIFSGVMSLLELERVSHDTEEILMASKSNVDIAGEMIAALNEQNDAMIYMAVVGDERESRRVQCLNSIEHLRLATESACERMSTTENAVAADSLRMQAERINQMANDYLDKRVHLHILETEATDSITPFNTQIWYADQYKVQYMNMSRHITKYMTGTNSTLGPEVNNLSHTARRAVTPVFISLLVMLVVVIMFYYFLRIYYLNPVLRINRSLGDYLTYKMPFDEDMEARDELKTLRDHIARLISKLN